VNDPAETIPAHNVSVTGGQPWRRGRARDCERNRYFGL